jgi:Domain of unknown function (DUF4333)
LATTWLEVAGRFEVAGHMGTLGDHRWAQAPRAVRWWGVAAFLAMAALAGCSLSAHSTLSGSSVEAKIASELAKTYDIAPPKVSCPASVRATVGTRFTCTATLDGQRLGVVGTVTDDHGHVEVRSSGVVIAKSGAEAELSRSLSKEVGHPVSVSCPLPTLLVAAPGHSFACTADIAGVERHIAVRVVNRAGDLSYRVLPYRP